MFKYKINWLDKTSYSFSVLKDDAGKPSELKRDAKLVSDHAYLMYIGVVTLSE
mgnify:CR=1